MMNRSVATQATVSRFSVTLPIQRNVLKGRHRDRVFGIGRKYGVLEKTGNVYAKWVKSTSIAVILHIIR